MAGDYNYDIHGKVYTKLRQTEPAIAKLIHAALGSAKTVLNVGAGAGSYEPEDRILAAVEPSAIMRAQRPKHLAPAINATADSLPFDDNSFDASMALLTVHHWPDPIAGLKELRRVTKGPIVILTFEPDAMPDFWLADYVPEMVEIDKLRVPSIDFIMQRLGGNSKVHSVPVPHDCADGFNEAFYARPEAFLDEEVRRSQSFWNFLPQGREAEFASQLKHDLDSGAWDKRYGHLRLLPEFTCALRLITNLP